MTSCYGVELGRALSSFLWGSSVVWPQNGKSSAKIVLYSSVCGTKFNHHSEYYFRSEYNINLLSLKGIQLSLELFKKKNACLCKRIVFDDHDFLRNKHWESMLHLRDLHMSLRFLNSLSSMCSENISIFRHLAIKNFWNQIW